MKLYRWRREGVTVAEKPQVDVGKSTPDWDGCHWPAIGQSPPPLPVSPRLSRSAVQQISLSRLWLGWAQITDNTAHCSCSPHSRHILSSSHIDQTGPVRYYYNLSHRLWRWRILGIMKFLPISQFSLLSTLTGQCSGHYIVRFYITYLLLIRKPGL